MAFLKTLQVVLAAIGIPSTVVMLFLSFSFYRLGSLVPDPATGRIYPVQMHGILYVTPLLGEVHIVLFFAGFACIMGLVAIGLWRRHRENSD